MRNTIHKAFNCLVLSRYSNEEYGVLSHECHICGQFHFKSDGYLFETLALDRDEPISPGTLGRVAVTDLYNHALPVIRYDTSGISSIILNNRSKFAALISSFFRSRHIDTVYDTAGRKLMIFAFDSILETLGRLGVMKQF